MTSDFEPALVPKPLVRDVAASVEFWTRLCGFEVRYHRLDEGFAYLVNGSAHVIVEQAGFGRNWITAPLERAYGRGVNCQVSVPDIEPIVAALRDAEHELFMEPEIKWYTVGDEEVGVQQSLVEDPDGSLIRFTASNGRRARLT